MLGSIPDVTLPDCWGCSETRREPHGTGAAGPRTGPGQPGHHRGPARRQPRRLGAGRPAVRRHPPRGRHPDRVRPWALRRLPPRARAPAFPPDGPPPPGPPPRPGGGPPAPPTPPDPPPPRPRPPPG